MPKEKFKRNINNMLLQKLSDMSEANEYIDLLQDLNMPCMHENWTQLILSALSFKLGNLSNSPVSLCLSQMLYWLVFSIQLILMYCMIIINST